MSPSTARILVHAPNWVGDHAMAFPFYAALQEIFPHADMVLLGRAWVSDLAPNGFDEIISLDGKKLQKGDLSRLRAQNFDLGFTLSPSFRSAWLLRKLNVRTRIGFASDWRSPLLSFAAAYNRVEHRALAYLRLLKPFTDPEQLFARFRDIQLKPASIVNANKTIIVCPGSTANSKKYPLSQWIAVISGIAKNKPDLKFVLLGANIDQTECEAIEKHFAKSKTKVHSLCAKTTLREAHAVIAAAKLCIANDSGLAHITSLTRTPLITWNGMGRRSETEPLTARKTLFDLELKCSPCFERECPRRDQPLACLTGILPQQIIKAALNYLRHR